MSKYIFTAKRDDYLTPQDVIEYVLSRNGLKKFDCDVCCTQNNIPANFRYKKDGLYLDKSGSKVSENDGLTGTWFPHNWCNPPFSMCEDFIKKAIKVRIKKLTAYIKMHLHY